MEMEAPLPDFLSRFPVNVLLMINDRIPCFVQRRRLAQASPAFCDAVRPQQQLAPRDLPWILLPRPGGPSSSCVLRGCDANDHDLDLDVPVDARDARYFGTYDVGWVFLALGQTHGHALLNLRTHQRFGIPDEVNLGGVLNPGMGTAIVAATLSSPPEHEDCVVAAICCFAPHQMVNGPSVCAFWRLGHPVPVNDDEEPTAAVSGPNLEDVIHHDGAFHFLNDEEDLLVFEPLVHDDGRLEMIPLGIRRFGFRRHYDGDAHIRYLVESREQLLMVVRLTPHLGQPTSAFRVFQMAQAPEPNGDNDENGEDNIAEYTWNELNALGGRMLFVGRGCSRSYEVANYRGFTDGVYFLDDGRFYGEERMFTGADARQYPCRDSGKWLSAEPVPRIDNFLPGQGPSNYSPPVWFLS